MTFRVTENVALSLFGASDAGVPVGLNITDELLCSIADIKTDGNTLPPPTLTVEVRELSGQRVIVVTVKPSDAPPVRYKSRIWIRIGPRRGTATAQDERILNEKRRLLNIPFDAQPFVTSAIDDLNLRYYEDEYLPSAFARDVLDANGRSIEERLASTKMIASVENTTPTVLGIVTLGTRPRDFIPGSYVQFVRIDGNDLANDIIDESAIDGTIAEVIRRAEEKFLAHNRTSVSIKGDTETRRLLTHC